MSALPTISITPTSVQAQTPTMVQATAVVLNELHIVYNPTTGILTAKALVTPYAVVNGAAVYGPSQVITTTDLVKAGVTIPSIGVATPEVAQGVSDWFNYVLTAQANLATAQTNLATAQTANPQVPATIATAQAAVTSAQAAIDPANG
jgi:hypothetical protein